ncbi:MAG TPA: GatB/YqeY domain-containing protein [Patescibacteria group bacterium]|nr:GatB/YqeY domain-containing protein [Patescibacteria group bacterium]
MKKQDLQSELKQAMLAKDSVKTSVLRMLISAIGYAEIQKGGAGYEATEEDVMAAIQKEAKQHRDSIEQFKNAGRNDLVEKEATELKILETYLPAQMDEEEVRKLVVDAVAQSGASTATDMGKVMGVLMPQVKGKADGGLVSRLVREALAQ